MEASVQSTVPSPPVDGDAALGGTSAGLDDVLTTVRGEAVRVRDVVDLLKVRRLFRSAIYDQIERRVVHHWCRELSLTPSDAEEQAARDRMRLLLGLSDPVQFQNFLRQNGISLQAWKEHVLAETLKVRLRDAIATPQVVESFYARHREQFQSVVLSRIVCQSRGDAERCHAEVAAGGEFAVAAGRWTIDPTGRYSAGFIGEVQRGFLPADLEPPIFAAAPGALVPPMEHAGLWHVFKVWETRGRDLDDTLRQRIGDRYFAEWLRREVNSAPA